jgi:phosphohistidine phosphatase
MKIYFVRHADAEDLPDDAARKLTAKGKDQSIKLGKFFRSNNIYFDAVYASPLIRAVQTAEYIVLTLEPDKKPQIHQTEFLLNDTPQEQFDTFIKSIMNHKDVMLVGHAPSMDERVMKMLGIATKSSFKMPKASVACVETTDGLTGILNFFISHKLL